MFANFDTRMVVMFRHQCHTMKMCVQTSAGMFDMRFSMRTVCLPCERWLRSHDYRCGFWYWPEAIPVICRIRNVDNVVNDTEQTEQNAHAAKKHACTKLPALKRNNTPEMNFLIIVIQFVSVSINTKAL